MSSMLKKGMRAGFGTLSKGLFRKYEHQLKEEEAEANLLREQNLALYQDGLLTNRAKVVADHESKLRKQEKLDNYELEKQKALEQGDISDQITLKESGKLYESLAKREGVAGLPSKEEFQEDMLFIDRASKGASPLSNDQKIEIIKNANEAWDKMSTLGSPEYDGLIAKHGSEKARQKFIEKQINSSVFGGTSMLDKASTIVSKEKEKKIIQEIKESAPEDAIKKIMKTQKVKRPEAEEIYKELTGVDVLSPDKKKKRPGFMRASFPSAFTDEEEGKKKKELSIFDM